MQAALFDSAPSVDHRLCWVGVWPDGRFDARVTVDGRWMRARPGASFYEYCDAPRSVEPSGLVPA